MAAELAQAALAAVALPRPAARRPLTRHLASKRTDLQRQTADGAAGSAMVAAGTDTLTASLQQLQTEQSFVRTAERAELAGVVEHPMQAKPELSLDSAVVADRLVVDLAQELQTLSKIEPFPGP